jgi:mRNA deadenylase 3'-5' endonuclease subunit Ccr4
LISIDFSDFSKEIETVNPDVLALQECDQFAQTWRPRLEALGYVTHYLTKDGEIDSSTGHGCLIAFKKSVFELADSMAVFLSKLADEYQDECSIAEFRRQNIAQIVALRCVHNPQLGVIVSNTHIFWNPKFPFVRVRQCERVLRSALKLQSAYSHFPLLLLGDWNITPDSVPYRFLTTRLAPNEADLRSLLTPSDHAAAIAAKQAARLNAESEQSRAPQRDIDQIATWTAEDFCENFPVLNDPNSLQRRLEVESFYQTASGMYLHFF